MRFQAVEGANVRRPIGASDVRYRVRRERKEPLPDHLHDVVGGSAGLDNSRHVGVQPGNLTARASANVLVPEVEVRDIDQVRWNVDVGVEPVAEQIAADAIARACIARRQSGACGRHFGIVRHR